MTHTRTRAFATLDPARELQLVQSALAGDGQAFLSIMQTHNQRLYRIARGVVRNDSEAEDIVQEAYVLAFAHLGSFRGGSSLGTWLSRIVINEALGRLRRGRKAEMLGAIGNGQDATIIQFPVPSGVEDPERTMAQRQILHLVERATDSLPDIYRTVFVARVLEGLSVEETADLLSLRPETVKTRLHRARHLVRKQLHEQIGPVLLDAFPFAGRRCARLSAAVMARLGLSI